MAPAVASASVHLAEIGTTLASGTARWRFGNVDWRIVSLLAIPGFVGAFIGAVILSSLSAEAAEPVVSGILLLLGWVGALLVGGLFAAPIAAWIVKNLPPRVLGLSLGALIIVTNLQTIGDAAGVDQDVLSAISVAFGIAWIAAMATLLIRARRSGARAAPVAA